MKNEKNQNQKNQNQNEWYGKWRQARLTVDEGPDERAYWQVRLSDRCWLGVNDTEELDQLAWLVGVELDTDDLDEMYQQIRQGCKRNHILARICKSGNARWLEAKPASHVSE